MSILIVAPRLTAVGGVANHYLGLKPFLPDFVKYFFISQNKSKVFFFFLLIDYLKFIKAIFIYKPAKILLNPSLQKRALLRDSVYLVISKLLGRKIIVFIHGWDKRVENKIDKFPFLFKRIFGLANHILVLSEEFKNKLIEWNLKVPITLQTTKVDESLLSDFEIKDKSKINNILFLARLEKDKGIYTAIETINMLIKEYDLNLIIAGTGSEYEFIRRKFKNNKHMNVVGHVSGNELINVFKIADIYLLPTLHGEGMPTSVLEAMAFGLPIITRPVGGIKDFFIEEEMGYLIHSDNPVDYYNKILIYINNPELRNKVGYFNYIYAKEHFYSSIVAKNLIKTVELV